MKPTVRIASLAGAAALLTVLAGCSQGGVGSEDPTTGEALDLGTTRGSTCVPAPPEDDETMFGETLLRQKADEPVTITDVSLVDSADMTLTEAFLVQVRVPAEMVVGIRYASDKGELPEKWDQRIDAEGAVVRPGDEWNLVLVVDSPPDLTASAKAARIRYKQGGTEYQQDTVNSILTTDVSCEEVLQEPGGG